MRVLLERPCLCVGGVSRLLAVQYSYRSAANWRKRTEIVQYCVDVVDQSIVGKRKAMENEQLDPEVESDLKQASYAEEVKVR